MLSYELGDYCFNSTPNSCVKVLNISIQIRKLLRQKSAVLFPASITKRCNRSMCNNNCKHKS